MPTHSASVTPVPVFAARIPTAVAAPGPPATSTAVPRHSPARRRESGTGSGTATASGTATEPTSSLLTRRSDRLPCRCRSGRRARGSRPLVLDSTGTPHYASSRAPGFANWQSSPARSGSSPDVFRQAGWRDELDDDPVGENPALTQSPRPRLSLGPRMLDFLLGAGCAVRRGLWGTEGPVWRAGGGRAGDQHECQERLARFSTVAGELGTPETVRDPRVRAQVLHRSGQLRHDGLQHLTVLDRENRPQRAARCAKTGDQRPPPTSSSAPVT
jgi:hypothetical protein